MSTSKTPRFRFKSTNTTAMPKLREKSPAKVQTNMLDYVRKEKQLPSQNNRFNFEPAKPLAKVMPHNNDHCSRQPTKTSRFDVDSLILDDNEDDDDDFVPFKTRRSKDSSFSSKSKESPKRSDKFSAKLASASTSRAREVVNLAEDSDDDFLSFLSEGDQSTKEKEKPVQLSSKPFSSTRRVRPQLVFSDSDEDYDDNKLNTKIDASESICLFDENSTMNGVVVPETVLPNFDLEIEESSSFDDEMAQKSTFEEARGSHSPVFGRKSPDKSNKEIVSSYLKDNLHDDIKVQRKKELSEVEVKTEPLFDEASRTNSPVCRKSPVFNSHSPGNCHKQIDSRLEDIKTQLDVDSFIREMRTLTDASNFEFRTETSIDKLKEVEYRILKKIGDILQLAEKIQDVSVMEFCKIMNIVELQSIRHIVMLKQVQIENNRKVPTVNKSIPQLPSPAVTPRTFTKSCELANEPVIGQSNQIHGCNLPLNPSATSKKQFKFTPMSVTRSNGTAANPGCDGDKPMNTDLKLQYSEHTNVSRSNEVGPSTYKANVKFDLDSNYSVTSKNDKPKMKAMETQDYFIHDSVFDDIDLNQIEAEYNQNRSFQSSYTSQQRPSTSTSTSVKAPTQSVSASSRNSCFQGTHKNDGSDPSLNKRNFPHSEAMLNVFRGVFGLKEFRTNQLAAVNAALLKQDCFILMPTGGGKSLCYQLPALLTNGVTIVISPLRSLIQDQVQKLCSLDIPAAHLSGEISVAQADKVYQQLYIKDGIKLLYVTPEKIGASNKFLNVMETLYRRSDLSRFVIDEVHCVSQWGHDFRPDYKKLHILREKFPEVPIMALTATATPRVRTDILHQLKIPNPKWFLQSFNRTNLRYSVKPKKGKSLSKELITLIREKYSRASGIVYCLSRNECDTVAEELSKAGLSAASYHAGLNDNDRVSTQDKWLNDRVKIVCATIAFGMGIDKPDVRFVFHYTLPKSIEGYYQESGRAGRDYQPADCILFYSYQDVLRHRKLLEMDKSAGNSEAKKTHYDNLYRIVSYCENKTECRRAQQLEYFGEIFDSRICRNNSQTCDNCLSKESYGQHDVTQDAMSIVKCVESVLKSSRSSFTLLHFTDIFKGSNSQKIIAAGHNKLPLHGKGEAYSRSDAERLMRKLVMEEYLKEELVITANDHAVAYVKLGKRAPELLNNKVTLKFPMQHAVKKTNVVPTPATNSASHESFLELLQSQCYQELLEECKRLAANANIYYANVMNMAALREMSINMPTTEEEMLMIPHVTKANFDKYGHNFLKVTTKYNRELPQPVINEAMELDEEDEFQSDSERSPYFPSADKSKRKKSWKPYAYKRTKKSKASSTQSSGQKSKWISKRKSTPKTASAAGLQKSHQTKKSQNNWAMPFP